jgi:hypothetical protein
MEAAWGSSSCKRCLGSPFFRPHLAARIVYNKNGSASTDHALVRHLRQWMSKGTGAVSLDRSCQMRLFDSGCRRGKAQSAFTLPMPISPLCTDCQIEARPYPHRPTFRHSPRPQSRRRIFVKSAPSRYELELRGHCFYNIAGFGGRGKSGT